MKIYPTFTKARESLETQFLTNSYIVHSAKWQGISVANKPEMAMHELLNTDFQVPIRDADLDCWRGDIRPNLPFADVHFEERVSGVPSNPGKAWEIWPWGNAASKFLEVDRKQFTHTYQERFWPKRANEATVDVDQLPRQGIRYEYADLDDLANHLYADPLSRQAYLPIWFPEDGTCTGRKPCTLGYHFIMRHDFLHVSYFIRSCDFIRHFNDDCYLTVRLLLWLLSKLRLKDPKWDNVKPGLLSFRCVSLHMFRNDFNGLVQKNSSHV